MLTVETDRGDSNVNGVRVGTTSVSRARRGRSPVTRRDSEWPDAALCRSEVGLLRFRRRGWLGRVVDVRLQGGCGGLDEGGEDGEMEEGRESGKAVTSVGGFFLGGRWWGEIG